MNDYMDEVDIRYEETKKYALKAIKCEVEKIFYNYQHLTEFYMVDGDYYFLSIERTYLYVDISDFADDLREFIRTWEAELHLYELKIKINKDGIIQEVN